MRPDVDREEIKETDFTPSQSDIEPRPSPEERRNSWGRIASPARTISSGEYEYNMEILENNKIVAFAIIGFGAVSSSIFIFVAMIRSLGKG